MGFRVDIRIHPKSDRRALAEASSDRVDSREFGLGFQVQAKHPGE
jgi:hypothetical protein